MARERARTDGLGDEEFEAVTDENWAATCLDDSERIVFRFGAVFDAGYGVPAGLLEELREHLTDEQVVELCVLLVHYGGLTRLAVALGLERAMDQTP
jgi:alkylhydroperoxidase family enzyme